MYNILLPALFAKKYVTNYLFSRRLLTAASNWAVVTGTRDFGH
jgi:hypothetical protein